MFARIPIHHLLREEPFAAAADVMSGELVTERSTAAAETKTLMGLAAGDSDGTLLQRIVSYGD